MPPPESKKTLTDAEKGNPASLDRTGRSLSEALGVRTTKVVDDSRRQQSGMGPQSGRCVHPVKAGTAATHAAARSRSGSPHSPRRIHAHRTATERLPKWTSICMTPPPMLMRKWLIDIWRRRISAKSRRGNGWTWLATPTRMVCIWTTNARCGRIVTGL